jgi:hypothetical protein
MASGLGGLAFLEAPALAARGAGPSSHRTALSNICMTTSTQVGASRDELQG